MPDALPPRDPPAAAAAAFPASPYFSTDEHPESPRPPAPAWKGMLLSAPASVRLEPRKPLFIVVRGYYRIAATNYPSKAALKLVATEATSKAKYEGEMGEKDPSPTVPPSPPRQLDPKIKERMTYTAHFNSDLVATVNLPRTPGTYRVRVELGPIKSNEVTVQILPQ